MNENATPLDRMYGSMRRNGLVRPRHGRMLGGVVAGLAQRFGIDPWLARVLFVVTLLVIPGSQLLVYPLLWVLMPAEPELQPIPPVTTVPGV